MKGSFAAAVSTALLALAGTAIASPDPAYNLVEDAVVSAAGEYGIAYNLQTGTIFYASMQPLPPTAITKTNTDPIYATSSVPIATTFLGEATVSTTLTQAATYSFESHANTASAAPYPTDDMAKFLRRWKDEE